MKAMKCPTCGGNCEYKYNQGYVCSHCGNVYSAEEISDTLMDKLNYANEKRTLNYDFEGALQLCEEILREKPDSQEAIWGALLAEYQIVYLKNAKNEYKPTLLNPDVSVPINKSDYYKQLNVEYKKMADFAETVRQEVVRESKQIPDYDVFISYKQHTRDNGNIQTEESEWAAMLYKRLSKSKLRVFYDEVSLKEGLAGWEPHIYAALKSSKYLIILGSSIENIESTWVKNEWKRFITYRKKDANKTFTVVRKNFKPEELDYDLQSQQMLNVTDNDWLDTLVKNVNDYFVKGKVEYLLTEAEAFILKRKFKKAKETYQKVHDADPRNPKGHWGLLMCKLKAMDDYDLIKRRKKIGKTKEYAEAVRYANGEEKARYEKVASDNLKHDTSGYERKNYNIWLHNTRVRRLFKKLLIILLVLVLSATAVLGGWYIYDKKSKEYSLMLDYGESLGTVSSVTINSSEDIPELPGELAISDKYYMDFVGWFTQPNCKGIQVTDCYGKSKIKADEITVLSAANHQIKLYAGFEVHKYTVTFYDNDGHSILKSVKAEYGTMIEDIGSDIHMGDMLVLTWSTSRDGEAFNGAIVADISLYATTFSITVQYDSNGGNDIPSTTVRVGDKVPMPLPERQYYSFAGWALNDKIVEYGFIAPEENITLVAQWNKTHFSLTLDSNGGLEDKTEIVKAGNTVSLPVISRQYYRFLGWEYNGAIVDNSFVMPQKDVVLTAKWEKTHYAVTLDSITQYVRIGESIDLPTRSKVGYEFKGWNYNGNTYTGQFMPSEDCNLTPVWEATTYTISLNSNGGSLAQSTAQIKYDSTYNLPVPTRSDYMFVGWYTTSDKYGIRMTNSNGSSVEKWNKAEDITLYAVWTKDYEIKLNRASCKDNNGYNPAESGTDIDILAHGDWDMLNLIIGGSVQDGNGDYFIPEGSLLTVSFKVLQDINNLPTSTLGGASVNWSKHWMQSDSYSGSIYGTDINKQTVGIGAYYINVKYTDGTSYAINKVNFLQDAKKNQTISTSLNINTNKRISSVEVVAVYELFYDYMNGIWDWDGTQCTANWRCSATINF